MMMKIVSVIVMCLYPYSVRLVSRVLKNIYLKKHLSVIASKYNIAIWKTRLRTFQYVQCLNIAPMEKAWFMAPMDKELWPQWNIPSYFIAPMEKAWFYEIIVMVNDKKDAL